MSNISDNPLLTIFETDQKGLCLPELKNIESINLLWKYLLDEEKPQEAKIQIVEELVEKIKINRYLCEYFSIIGNEDKKSIYIFLFELYLKQDTTTELKNAILNLLKELIINIEISKDIFEFIFQKISLLYRNEEKVSAEKLEEYLTLLNSILGDTVNCQKPLNYYSCAGNNKFVLDFSDKKIKLGRCVTIMMNFKMSNIANREDSENDSIVTLMKITFSNGQSFTLDLKYPMFLIVKEIHNNFIKTLPTDDWINLIFTIVSIGDKIQAYFFVNGENKLSPYKLSSKKLKSNETIDSIEFFDKFKGEVSSIAMMINLSDEKTILNNVFLGGLKQFQEGIWKRKIFDQFIKFLKNINKKDLSKDLAFIFTPFNYSTSNPDVIENSLEYPLKLRMHGSIRNHKYQCYQKKLVYLGVIQNYFPIAELFLIHPQTLNDNNFALFLKIIINIINYRKNNIKTLKECKFFQIISLFIEKYPKYLFNESVLELFNQIGKTIFSNNIESLCRSYFKHILLNEKILSKYSEDLQIKFWDQLSLFCQSDKEQMESSIQMNRICLILRFYDKNKYTEMCCEKHLSMIKEEFVGSKVLMNPTMDKKLKNLETILKIIIASQEPKNVIALFKLLTLDLSPCLTQFILNIFINAFEQDLKNDTWKNQLIGELTKNNYETILVNTFIHNLPDIRYDILTLAYYINHQMILNNNNSFEKFESMIKTCLLPQNMFYSTKKELKESQKEIEKQQEIKKKEMEEIKSRKTVKRGSSFLPSNIEQMLQLNKIREMNQAIVEVQSDNDSESESESESKSKSSKDEKESEESKDSKDNNNKNKDNDKKNDKENIKDNEKDKEKKEYNPEDILNKYLNPNSDVKKIRTHSRKLKKELNENDNENKDNKDNKDNKVQNDINKKEDGSEEEKIIIIKDEYFKEYFQKIFDILLLWLMGEKTSTPLNSLNFGEKTIKNPNILKILFIFERDINNITFTNTFLNTIFAILLNSKNSFLFLDNIIVSSFLDLAFKFYQYKDDSTCKQCYDVCKEILLQIYIGAIDCEDKKDNLLPNYGLEIVFTWADIIITEQSSKVNILYKFIYEFLFEFLEKFTIKYGKQMNFLLNDDDFNINNYYLKNYLMMETHLFNFSFHFAWDLKANDFISENESNFEVILGKYFNTIRLSNSTENTINEKWYDYSFFYDLYKRICLVWNFPNIYEKYNIFPNKYNRKYKYEEILKKIILDKNIKDAYKTHLQLLCYKEEYEGNELISPLIKLIPISLMNLILMANKLQNENEFKFWLKEYKHFTMFIIIASSNLIRLNQLELYNEIQLNCIGPIVTSLCFLHYCSNNLELYKDKSIKALNSILLFIFIILDYEFNYISKHKTGLKIFSFSSKPLRNDLRMSAVFLLFTEYIKDKSDTPIFNLKNIEETKNMNFKDLYKLLDRQDFYDALYKNQNLVEKIYIKFYTLSSYKKIMNSRIFRMPLLKDELEYEYIDEILRLLPLYEKELMKYSNNTLEQNIKKRNGYKIIKKKSFSWNGFWSDKKLFFENVDSLKLKIKNHYTKTLMKPILVPILDIDYYLPELTGFKKSDLFLPSEKKNYKLIMDIDRILKLKEQSQLMMNQIRESFGEMKTTAKMNYLRNIFNKSNKKLAEKLIEISNNLDFGKEEEFTILENEADNKVQKQKYFLSCLVKTSHHIKGVCFIDDDKLNFKVFLNQKTGNSMSDVALAFTNEDEDYDHERNTCFGSYLVCHPKDKDLYKISLNYDEIKWVIRRRYYYKNSALEIFTKTNKSYYFNFKYESDREIVINAIKSKFKSLFKIKDDLKEPKDSLDNIIGYSNDLYKNKVKLSRIITKWKEWKITNFEFLMWMNIFGNRSYNDLSQYPVFPWILSNYEDPLKSNKSYNKNFKSKSESDLGNMIEDEENEENIILDYSYRNLKLPMGMLEINDDGARKELFMETYETLKSEEEQEIKPYIYGSNYSNPIYVCNYLMRLFPFTHIAIELQGNKLDDPNRLFFSVKQSFFNSTTQKTDVRELVPEFFYFPEIFININNLNMGVRDDGQEVNDVLTPCNNNPYEFVFTMKKVLEGDRISRKIRKWIDLIFGYKARGKDAELANNIFTEASYQENININKVEDKESYLRLVEFGLIPNQIMNKELIKKEKKEDVIKGKQITNSSGKFTYEKISKKFTSNVKESIFVMKAGCFSDDTIAMYLSNNIFLEEKINYVITEKGYEGDISTKYLLNQKYNYMKNLYSSEAIDKAICFYNHGKDLIIGGFYDGKIILTNFSKKEEEQIEIIPFKDEKPILSIEIDKEEKFLFIGNSIGNVLVYKINQDNKNDWEKHCLLTDQNSSISHIKCNDELNVWASLSNDGCICLYTLPSCKLIRCIKAPPKNYSYIFLSDSPLPCIVLLSDEDNTEILVYSINGKLIFKRNEYNKILCPMIIKDIYSYDYLAYIGNDHVNILNLPKLEVEVTINNLNEINYICVSEDKKTLYAINKDGTETFIIKEEMKKGLSFQNKTSSLYNVKII